MNHQSANFILKDAVALEIQNIDEQSKMAEAKVPGRPVQKSDLETLYTLWCMERAPQVTQKTFRYSGSFKDACQKAKNYCENMRYRFLYCRPFITDLDNEQKIHMGIGTGDSIGS